MQHHPGSSPNPEDGNRGSGIYGSSEPPIPPIGADITRMPGTPDYTQRDAIVVVRPPANRASNTPEPNINPTDNTTAEPPTAGEFPAHEHDPARPETGQHTRVSGYVALEAASNNDEVTQLPDATTAATNLEHDSAAEAQRHAEVLAEINEIIAERAVPAVEKMPPKDQAKEYFGLAVMGQNPELAERIDKPKMHALALGRIASATGDQQVADRAIRVAIEADVAETYPETVLEVASALRRPDVIRELLAGDGEIGDNFLGQYAVKACDASVLPEIVDDWTRTRTHAAIAYATRDPELAQTIENDRLRDNVFSHIAYTTRDPAILEKIANPIERDQTAREIALETRDATVAHHIKSDTLRATALEELNEIVADDAQRAARAADLNHNLLPALDTADTISANDLPGFYADHLTYGNYNPEARAEIMQKMYETSAALRPALRAEHLMDLTRHSGDPKYALEAARIIDPSTKHGYIVLYSALVMARKVTQKK